jgi:hypothetical protein
MTGAQAGQLQEGAPRPEEAGVYEAPAVLRLLWADPQYMPEHIAVWSLKYFGPRAQSAVTQLRESQAPIWGSWRPRSSSTRRACR